MKDGGIWGGLFKKHFKERLMLFLDLYVEWNEAKTPEERLKIMVVLRENKSSIFQPFFNYMDELAKSNSPKRKQEFKQLLRQEKEINQYLGDSFSKLVKAHPDVFVDLSKKLNTFKKRNNDSSKGLER